MGNFYSYVCLPCRPPPTVSHSVLYTNALRIIFPILARLLSKETEFYATLLYPLNITDKSKEYKITSFDLGLVTKAQDISYLV